jgi:hypothetical protein
MNTRGPRFRIQIRSSRLGVPSQSVSLNEITTDPVVTGNHPFPFNFIPSLSPVSRVWLI